MNHPGPPESIPLHSQRAGSCKEGDPQRGAPAFTRTDLLAIIAMALLLGGFFFSAQATGARKSSILQCMSNLRQTGSAIDAYAADHGDVLPGPVWAGVLYTYRSGEVGRMASFLATYLGLPAPDATWRTVPQLNCPASDDAKPQKVPQLPNQVHISYISNSSVTNSPTDIVNVPFGYPSSPFGVAPAKVSALRRPSDQWALTDIDRVWLWRMGMGPAYYSYVPILPVHNLRAGAPGNETNRNHLFFDGSVRTLKTAF